MEIDDYSVGMDSLHDNHIVVFANQKGGTGKTTICAHFANYLSNDHDIPVQVFDADLQQNLVDQRKDDIAQKIGEPKYKIEGLSLSDRNYVHNLIKFWKKQDTTVLIDAPGNLTQKGLVEVFLLADFIIVPFHYDLNSIRSTRTFVLAILKLRQLHPEMHPRIIFFCNKKRQGTSTSEELNAWKLVKKFFTQFGAFVSPIGLHQAIVRYNTIESNKDAKKYTRDCFDSIYKIIYNIKDDE